MAIEQVYKFIYQQDDLLRLDEVLTQELKKHTDLEISRSQLKQYIKAGQITLNSKLLKKPGTYVKQNDEIEITLTKKVAGEIKAYDFPLKIVFEDENLIVLNKPADLTVHPGAGNYDKTLLNALVYYADGKFEPLLVHRLDKDTTGLLLVAKSPKIHKFLADQFAERTVSRQYYALALVTPRANRKIQQTDSGQIETLLGRDERNRLKIAVQEKSGREALTYWQVTEKYNHAYLLKLKLATGRTHQIRVHLEHVGSPIIGDRTYGNFSLLSPVLRIEAENFGRQALHAAELEFIDPKTKEKKEFKVDLPKDFKDLVTLFRES